MCLLLMFQPPKGTKDPKKERAKREEAERRAREEGIIVFLADRTYGRAIATLLRPSSSSSSVTLCIVAKRCLLEQKLLLRAYRKSYMRN